MGDQMILEEPNAKKAKMSSPSLITSENSGFGFVWGDSVLDLPDELLETSTSNGPSTSGDAGREALHSDNVISTASSVPSSYGVSNGPTIGHNVQVDSSGFNTNQQQHPHSGVGIRPPPPPFGSNPGSSVLEELLTTNRTSTGAPSTTTQIHGHQLQNSVNATNLPMAPMNQRIPPGIGAGLPMSQQKYTMSPRMNSIASPPNGPSNPSTRPMTAFSSEMAVPSNMYGNVAASQYAGPPNRLPQSALNQPQQFIGSSGIRAPPQQSLMNGPPSMNPGLIRVQRPPNMMNTGPPPNQQMMPFNVHMQQQQQQQQTMAAPSMHMNARMMNGPSMTNVHMSSQGSYEQDPHATQPHQAFGMLPPHQQPHLTKTPMQPGQRPKAHSDFVGIHPAPPPPSMPSHSISSPFPPQTGGQLHVANQRGLGPRMGFGPSNMHLLNNNTNMSHMNAQSNVEMVSGTSVNTQNINNQQQHPGAGPPLGNLPQQSPVASMLMSPSNNILNGIGGPLSVPPPTPGDVVTQSVGGSGNLGSGGAPQDPEKRKLIQQQLVLLLHAHKCQQRERTNDQQQCTLPHCNTMKGVLSHMTSCADGRSCTVPHCASSRQIIAHWKSCNRPDCPVCLPLKQMTDNKNNRGAAGSGAPNEPLQGESNGARFFGRPTATSNFDSFLGQSALETINGPNPLRGPGSVRQPIPTGVAPSGVGVGLSSAGTGNSDGAGSGYSPRWPPPEGASVQKEWHKQVTIDLRYHLVSKLVKAIFPSPDPAAIHDQRIKDLVQYARKVEKEMFELANDREEYYHLLAEKIYKIQKELQEKKQRRLEQAQSRLQGAPPDPGGPMAGLGVPSASAFDITPAPNRIVSQQDPLHKAPATAAPLCNMSGANNTTQASANGGNVGSGFLNIKEETGVRTAGPTGNSVTKYEPGIVKTEMTQSAADGEKPSTSAGEQSSDTKSITKVARKTFSVDELKNALLPVWDKLERMDDAIPFRVPVDPDLLGIPDYFDIIKHPMDLSTIKEKLLNGEYSDPWQFCDDMWLMFENAWSYNRKNSKVYKYCTKLSETFVDDIDPVMRSLGYCCGRKLAFTPLALVCYGQPMCAIPRDAVYYCYEDNKSQFGVSSERYTYCKKCFEDIQGDSINMSDDSSTDNVIPKKNFKQLKNDQIEYEPFVDCVECGRKWHQICALHMDQIYFGGFVCETCLKMKTKKRSENRFTAKRLPQCKLSQHLEKRINDFLKNKVPPDQTAGEVVIRVLSSSDKEVEIKPYMKSKFCATGQFPEKFPYRAKAIFAFEVIDGVEVCFFGLHVQEFGSNCPAPNQRRVYIAYLDSVHFFTPKSVRTQVYHELLLGYLDYVKKLGYTMAHIWACPPSEGDDYIFHCHPPEQKIPKPKRLQEWYKKLLDRGIVERTVTDYKDIYEFYQKEEVLNSVTELPFFEGDYWPNVVEECIKEVDMEEAERRREAEAQAAAGVATDDLDDDADEVFGNQGKKRNAKGQKKSKSKSKSTNYKKSKKGGAGTGNDLTDKIVAALEKHKEVFFVVRLYSKQSAAAMPPIVDPDPHITCEFMDGRDSFLSTARDRHWEFSSLRRAKYSTLALCYELHTQGSDKFVYTCNTCKNNNAKWHCSECDDFDLCQGCYEKTHHEHKMEQIKSIMADDTASSQEQGSQNPRDRNESIQRCIQSLVHACQCRDANCRRLSCHKMKRVVQHTKMCKKRQSGSCPVCKQLIALCLYHARHCQEGNCPVPFCQNIRQKLAEQQAQLKKKRDREMMRRINFMSNQATAGPNAAVGGAPSTPYQQHPQPSPAPMASMISPSASSVNIQGQQPMVNPAAMMVARDIEKIAQQQQQQASAGLYPVTGGNRMQAVRAPSNLLAAGGMGTAGRLPVSSVPPVNHQPQMWETGKPRGYHSSQMSSMSAMQPPQNRMLNARVGMGGPDNMPAPSVPNTALSIQQQQKVAFMLEKMKSARSTEERDLILREMQQDPLVLQAILRAIRKSGHQPPAQLQQQLWNGNMAPPAVGSQQPRPLQQQQYYGNSGPSGVRMMQHPQQQSPQGFQQMQPDMNSPRHMSYPANYGGPSHQGNMYGNAGLRQPISPQMGNSLASANILNQVKSPQTSSLSSPGGIHSPHIGAPTMMHLQQQQLPANIMADQGGNDVLGDQDKFL